jgi:hypothetical protein
MVASRIVNRTFAAKGEAQILGLQKISKNTSPVYLYSVGRWGVGLPLLDLAVERVLRFVTKLSNVALSSAAASAEKANETEPSVKFRVKGMEDMGFYYLFLLILGIIYLLA